MSPIRTALAHVSAAADELQCALAEFAALSDADLMQLQSDTARVRERLDAFAATAAGEITRRSSRDLGLAGLAQRTGFRTPASLIQKITGTTAREAVRLVSAGESIHDAKPWLAAVGEALAAGAISVDAAAAIRTGLGSPDDAVTVDQLTVAAAELLLVAREINVDQLGTRARTARDDLDEAGIAVRERDLRSKEYLRVHRRPDGMVSGSFLYAPENAALLTSALDAITAPRRGGPRMVDEAERARATAIIADTRTTEQFAAAALIEMIRIAADVDAATVFGVRRPAVQVLTTARSLRQRRGRGRIEGSPSPVSIETVERIACADGTVTVEFDGHANRSMSVERSATSPAGSASRSRHATAGAARQGARGRLPGRKRTTSNSGIATMARPTWKTEFSCAAITTSCCMTTIGRSVATAAGIG